jgi:hypothetical protein
MQAQDARKPAPAVVMFESEQAADAAVHAMRLSGGSDLRQVSMVARAQGAKDRLVGLVCTRDGFVFRGRDGAFWTALAQGVDAAALVYLPPFGTIAALGPIAHAFADGRHASHRNRDASPLTVALGAAGIPKAEIQRCETALWGNQIIMVMHPAAAQVSPRTETDDSRAMPVLKVV